MAQGAHVRGAQAGTQSRMHGEGEEGREAGEAAASPMSIGNQYFQLTFDPTTNLLASMTNKVSGVTVALTQAWYW